MKIGLGDFWLGDCLELMPSIPDASVDMVLADLPYGSTACAWDSIIPLAALWDEYRRITKPESAIVLTASQPFTSLLGSSNTAELKYGLVWQKSRVGGFWDVKFRPLKAHEDILVFSRGGCANGSKLPMVYNPQGLADGKGRWTNKPVSGNSRTGSNRTGERVASNYPRSVLAFDSVTKPVHPTQKPVALFEYLIRTYTEPGALVLDNVAGSGTTAVAAERAGRRWLCIEQDPQYYERACARVLDEWLTQDG